MRSRLRLRLVKRMVVLWHFNAFAAGVMACTSSRMSDDLPLQVLSMDINTISLLLDISRHAFLT